MNLKHIIREEIYKTLSKENIIQYIKSFGQKGKLPSFTGSLRELYKPFLRKAYEWASEKIFEIKRNGFVYFEFLFRTYVISKLTFNKRGLIYVERSIEIDTSKNLSDFNFESIGECWSWKRHNSRSYCAPIDLTNNSIVNVVLCGYVHPLSIDWLETIYLNSYDMKNETEIRMNDNANVEVAYVLINGVKYHIDGSFLLNASADKYKRNL